VPAVQRPRRTTLAAVAARGLAAERSGLRGFAAGLVGAALGEPFGQLAAQEAPLAPDLGCGDVARAHELGERARLDAEELGRGLEVEDFAGGSWAWRGGRSVTVGNGSRRG